MLPFQWQNGGVWRGRMVSLPSIILSYLYSEEPIIEIHGKCWEQDETNESNHLDFLVATSPWTWRSCCETLKNIFLELELWLVWGFNVFYVLKKWQIKRQWKEALDESSEIRNIAMKLKNILSRPLGVCKSGRGEIAACAFCTVRCSLNNTREGASVQSLLKPQRKASHSQVAGYTFVFKA